MMKTQAPITLDHHFMDENMEYPQSNEMIEFNDEIIYIDECDAEKLGQLSDSDAIVIREEELPDVKPTLMPYREHYIKTKPQITISKKFNGLQEKLYVPPSTCTMTINERFTQLNCRIMKHTIDPGHEETVYSNTLFGRLKRRAAASPYAPAYNRATYLAAMRLKKRSIHHHKFANLADLEPGRPVDIYAKYKAMRSQRRYYTGPPKTRDELDEEIDDYMAKRGLVDMNDDDDDNGGGDNNDNDRRGQSPRDDYKNPSYFKQVMAEIKNMSKEEAKAKLDEDLDSYFGLARKRLDDDLENYRKQGPTVNQLDEDLDNYHKQGSTGNQEPINVDDDDFDL